MAEPLDRFAQSPAAFAQNQHVVYVADIEYVLLFQCFIQFLIDKRKSQYELRQAFKKSYVIVASRMGSEIDFVSFANISRASKDSSEKIARSMACTWVSREISE